MVKLSRPFTFMRLHYRIELSEEICQLFHFIVDVLLQLQNSRQAGTSVSFSPSLSPAFGILNH